MKEEHKKRLAELLKQGEEISALISKLRSLKTGNYNTNWRAGRREHTEYHDRQNVRNELINRIDSQGKSWFYSSAKSIGDFVARSGVFWEECEKLRERISMFPARTKDVYCEMFDLLVAICNELERGLLDDSEYIFAAETFSDFLDHAELFLSENKLREASVLASAVLEDSMKKIIKKNAIETPGDKSLEDLINALKTKGIFRATEAKTLKACAGVRKHAFHAEWNEIEQKDVELLVAETKRLLKEYL